MTILKTVLLAAACAFSTAVSAKDFAFAEIDVQQYPKASISGIWFNGEYAIVRSATDRETVYKKVVRYGYTYQLAQLNDKTKKIGLIITLVPRRGVQGRGQSRGGVIETLVNGGFLYVFGPSKDGQPVVTDFDARIIAENFEQDRREIE